VRFQVSVFRQKPFVRLLAVLLISTLLCSSIAAANSAFMGGTATRAVFFPDACRQQALAAASFASLFQPKRRSSILRATAAERPFARHAEGITSPIGFVIAVAAGLVAIVSLLGWGLHVLHQHLPQLLEILDGVLLKGGGQLLKWKTAAPLAAAFFIPRRLWIESQEDKKERILELYSEGSENVLDAYDRRILASYRTGETPGMVQKQSKRGRRIFGMHIDDLLLRETTYRQLASLAAAGIDQLMEAPADLTRPLLHLKRIYFSREGRPMTIREMMTDVYGRKELPMNIGPVMKKKIQNLVLHFLGSEGGVQVGVDTSLEPWLSPEVKKIQSPDRRLGARLDDADAQAGSPRGMYGNRIFRRRIPPESFIRRNA
jgi:hypothetical protein